jgi:hypothetical protein
MSYAFECLYAEFLHAECLYAECLWAEWHYTTCHYAKCNYTEYQIQNSNLRYDIMWNVIMLQVINQNVMKLVTLC